MLSLVYLGVALWLSGLINEHFVEFDCYTPVRGALLLGSLIVGPLYAVSPLLSLLTIPYAILLYITMPVTGNFSPSRRSKRFAANIPGPPTYFPYFGHAFLLASCEPERIIDFIKEIFHEFSRLFCLKVFGSCWTVLRDPEDLEVLLGSMKYIEKGPEYTTLMSWLREGLLTSSGEKWKTRRKLFTPTFHFKILENNVESLNKNSKILLKKILEKNGEPFGVEKYIRACALDVIAETAMGISLEAQEDKNSDYIQTIQKVTEISVLRMVKFWLYKDSAFMCTLSGLIHRKALRILHGFTGKIISERKRSYKDRTMNDIVVADKKPKPFLDCLIELDLLNPNSLTDLDIREEVDTFMFEGHDTTSSALMFSLLLLGNHPEVQETAYREQCDIFIESDREVTTTDLKAMTYLEQVIKEVLRLYPPVPMMTRFLKEDLTLPGNIVLPKTSSVVISPFLTHRHPKHFPDPELFDPERFSPENARNRHPFAYIPFSAGPRNCIGQKFAMMELKTVLSTILRFSRIEAITKIEAVKPLSRLILQPDCPIIIRAHSR